MSNSGTPLVELKDISIAFGGIKAVDRVSVDLYPGEVVGLLGHNGAGKSTLIKCLSGAYKADSGDVYINGEKVVINNPRDARGHNIETIYQTLALADNLDAASNLFLGREIVGPGGFLDDSKMEAETRKLMGRLNPIFTKFAEPVSALSGGQRQSVAIARAVYFDAKIVIMDEPTAALGVKESRRVLELILDVKSRGIPIVLISHNMPHVFEVADRIHVHRLGKRLCVIDPKDHSMADAVALMTGAKEPEPA